MVILFSRTAQAWDTTPPSGIIANHQLQAWEELVWVTIIS